MMELHMIDKISCSELKEIVTKVSKLYNLFPGFAIGIDSTRSAWYTQWGMVILPEFPNGDELSSFSKYFLLLGLGYHGILPATELNRLIMLAAARSVLSGYGSEVHGFLLSLLCLFAILSNLSSKEDMNFIVRESVKSILESKSTFETPLGNIVREFYNYILGREIPERTKRIINIALANIPLYAKAKIFFKELLAGVGAMNPWSLYERELRRCLIPISPTEIMNGRGIPISLQEMEQLGEIDYKFAKEIAKKLDERLKKSESLGKEPAFSQDKVLIQKLLSERRYLAAARRARIKVIISLIENKIVEVEPKATNYGFCEWYLGDDEEKINIEVSADTFGRVIPDISTLQELHEIIGDTSSLKKSIRHIELVIDTSGSMSGNSIERAIDVSMALIEIARKHNMSVGISTFSSGAWEGIHPTFDYDIAEEIVLRLDSEGGTNIRGVFSILNSHLASLYDQALVAIITDTAIYDIKFPDVLSNLIDLKERSVVMFFAITHKSWEKAEDVLKILNVPVVYLPPNIPEQEGVETILEELSKIC